MTAKAAKATAIAGTRLEAPCSAASGCLSPCVSLSGVSATCVPYVSAQSQDFSSPPISKTKKSRRVDDPATTLARLPTQIRLKSWAYMVNDQLFLDISRVRRFLSEMPEVSDGGLFRVKSRTLGVSSSGVGFSPHSIGAIGKREGCLCHRAFQLEGCKASHEVRQLICLVGQINDLRV